MNTKIYLFFLSILLVSSGVIHAQTGIGTNNPDPSAQLEVTSTEKGVLIPRMSESEKMAISNPANGLLIYQTDGENVGFYYYDVDEWVYLGAQGPPGEAGVSGPPGGKGDPGPGLEFDWDGTSLGVKVEGDEEYEYQDLQGPAGGGGGAIIPFASGTPVTLTTILGGSTETGALIGFGASASGISAGSSQIDLTGAPGTLLNMAFVVPRDGIITDISASFSTVIAVALIGTDLTVTAQLYSNTSGSDNFFDPIPGAVATLNPLSGVLSIGSIASGQVTGLNIPVTAGTRLMMVFSLSAVGIGPTHTLNGYASAGLAIK